MALTYQNDAVEVNGFAWFRLRPTSFENGVLRCASSGVAQGVITGIRGLCNGLGPALYGIIFYLFHVNLNTDEAPGGAGDGAGTARTAANATSSHFSMMHHIHEVRTVRYRHGGGAGWGGGALVSL